MDNSFVGTVVAKEKETTAGKEGELLSRNRGGELCGWLAWRALKVMQNQPRLFGKLVVGLLFL